MHLPRIFNRKSEKLVSALSNEHGSGSRRVKEFFFSITLFNATRVQIFKHNQANLGSVPGHPVLSSELYNNTLKTEFVAAASIL